MNIKNQEIFSEVYSVLDMLGNDFIKKVPTKIYKIIEDNRLKSYTPVYTFDTDLKKQNIKKESIAMIALLHLYFWCDSDLEKNKLENIFKDNEKKYKAMMEEKNDISNFITKNVDKPNKTQTIEIINFLKKFF